MKNIIAGLIATAIGGVLNWGVCFWFRVGDGISDYGKAPFEISNVLNFRRSKFTPPIIPQAYLKNRNT